MPDRGFVRENDDARAELRELAERLDEPSLQITLSSGWTVAAALCHLAFWDQRAFFLLAEWERAGKLEPTRLSPQSIDSINHSVNAIAGAVAGRDAVRLALDSAAVVDAQVAGLGDKLVEDLFAAGLDRHLRRSLHRREHMQKIREALQTASGR
jgi:hypothetical protein